MAKEAATAQKFDAETHLPQGFEQATPPKAWVIREPGTMIQGVVVSREERGGSDKGKFFYEIEITEPHNLMVQIGPKPEDGGKPPQPATKGMIVALDEIARIRFLEDLWGDPENEWEAFIRFVTKKQHPKDRTKTIWITESGKKKLGKRQGV